MKLFIAMPEFWCPCSWKICGELKPGGPVTHLLHLSEMQRKDMEVQLLILC